MLDKQIFYQQCMRTYLATIVLILVAYVSKQFWVFFLIGAGYGVTELRVKTFINCVISMKFSGFREEGFIIYRTSSNLAVATTMLIGYFFSPAHPVFIWSLLFAYVGYCAYLQRHLLDLKVDLVPAAKR